MVYRYKDFNFIFNRQKKNEMDLFIKYLDSNYSFFYNVLPHNISFVDNKKDNYTYVRSTIIYLDKVIKELMDDESIKKLKSKPDIVMYLYKDYLFYLYDKKNTFNKFFNDKDYAYILSLLAYVKYDDFNQIRGVILNSKYSRDKLIDEVRDETRVDLFNDMLDVNNDAILYRFDNLYNIIVPLFEEFDEKFKIRDINYDDLYNDYDYTDFNFNELCDLLSFCPLLILL